MKIFDKFPLLFLINILLISCEADQEKNKNIIKSDSSITKDSGERIIKDYPISKEEDNIVSASFPGGKDDLNEFIEKNLWNNKSSSKVKSGTVTIGFSVLVDGSLSDFKVIEGIEDCEECNKESIRLAKKMPKWEPAYRKDGEAKEFYLDKQAISIEFK